MLNANSTDDDGDSNENTGMLLPVMWCTVRLHKSLSTFYMVKDAGTGTATCDAARKQLKEHLNDFEREMAADVETNPYLARRCRSIVQTINDLLRPSSTRAAASDGEPGPPPTGGRSHCSAVGHAAGERSARTAAAVDGRPGGVRRVQPANCSGGGRRPLDDGERPPADAEETRPGGGERLRASRPGRVSRAAHIVVNCDDVLAAVAVPAKSKTAVQADADNSRDSCSKVLDYNMGDTVDLPVHTLVAQNKSALLSIKRNDSATREPLIGDLVRQSKKKPVLNFNKLRTPMAVYGNRGPDVKFKSCGVIPSNP